MQEEAHLIGLEAVTGRALRLQGQLVVFALVFHVATGTVDGPVEHLGAGLLHIRYDQARVDALCGPLDLDDHTARARPCSRLVTRRVKAGSLAPPTRLGPLGLLDDLLGQVLHHRVAREAYAIAQVRWRCKPRQNLGRSQVAVTAQDAPSVGPGVSQPLDHALEDRQHWGTAAAFGLEDRGDQAPRETFRKGAWPETIPAIIAIVADMFLCTMGAVLRGIDIEHDDLGGGGRRTREIDPSTPAPYGTARCVRRGLQSAISSAVRPRGHRSRANAPAGV